MTYLVRPMTVEDVPDLTALLNHTIALGGSTAYETAFDPAGFTTEFLTDPALISSVVAVAEDGSLAGFQVLYTEDDAEGRIATIASFTDQRRRFPGAGQALFPVTREAAQTGGALYIRATIRADNALGLRYYRGLGFCDHSVRPQVPLKDGTPVDRIETRYPLG